jgi:TolB-like protein/tetratricopeptide (TPR) repeat protein
MLLPLVLLLGVTDAPRPVVSVLYFDNQTNKAEYDVLRKGFADMMVTDLVAWDGVTVVERDRLEAVLNELKLQQSKGFDKATAVKVGKLIGAQYLVTGSLLMQGDGKLRIDARLIAAEGGKDVTAASVTGDKDKVFDLEQELVTKLTSGIDAKVRDTNGRRKVKVPDFESLLAYSKAIDLSDQGKLEEASAAMQAVVSKAPAFLMARERKQQLLKKLEEFEKRKKDMTTASVLELGKLSEQALAQEAGFDAMDEKAQCTLMAMRVVRGRYLMRVLKQDLSFHDGNFRIALKGKEAHALGIERAWLENQRRFEAEAARAKANHGYGVSCSSPLTPETVNLLRDASMGAVEVHDPFHDLIGFVLEGRAMDGPDSFRIGPALGDLDEKERKAAFDAVDRRIQEAVTAYEKATAAEKQRTEWPAIDLLQLKAEVLLRLDRDEDAIAALQKILDLFPSSQAAPRAEEEIKKVLGAVYDNSREKQERWAKALSGCDDMDIRVGMDTLSRKLSRMGLKGLDAQAAELEKACKPTQKNRSAFAYMYEHLALTAGQHDDCEGFRRWFGKYVEAGGSVNDMLGYQKNYTPWCELGDITRQVMWFSATLDRHWTLELTDGLSSVLSYDQKVLSLNGRSTLHEDFYVRLEAKQPGQFACVTARWKKRGGGSLEGPCELTLTKVAQDKGDYDEGTFSASFVDRDEGFARKIELTDGKFRLRRQ